MEQGAPIASMSSRAVDATRDRVRLPITWLGVATPPSSDTTAVTAASRSSVLFVHIEWLCALLRAKPTARAVLRGNARVEDLWTFHETLDALACVVRAKNAWLCVIGDNISAAPAQEELKSILRLHGLSVDGIVAPSEGSCEMWAMAHGLSSMAILHEDDPGWRESGKEERLKAIWGVWDSMQASTCYVEPCNTRNRGVILVATRACVAGDCLLELPIHACLTSDDAPTDFADALLPKDDYYGRLLLALLHKCESEPDHPHSRYFKEVFRLDEMKDSLMVLWDDKSDASKRAVGSLSFERSRKSRADILSEAADLAIALGRTAATSSPEQYLHAKLVLQTRARSPMERRHAL